MPSSPHRIFARCFLLSMAVGLPLHTTAAEVVIEAKPGGAVGGLAAARDEVRKLKAAQPGAAVRVRFAPGTYALTEAVIFGPEDSGSSTAPIVYEAGPGGPVVFSGGRRITGWKPDSAGRGAWSVEIPEAKAGTWRFDQLWINGRRATRARMPNTGYFAMYSQASAETFPGMKDPAFEAFEVRPSEMAILAKIPSDERPGMLLTVMHAWTVGQCRVADINEAARAVRIVGRSRYPFVEFEPDQRYFIEGVRAALDAPGEWLLSSDGRLLYIPLPGEDMANAEVMAPVANQLMLLQGNADGTSPIEHLQFRGITFAHSQEVYPKDGYHDGQAASQIGGAIELTTARNIVFQNCQITRVGEYGIWFRKGAQDCLLSHTEVRDLGAGGVRLGETQISAEDAGLVQRIRVDDCIIQSGGRLFPSACGVFLAHAADCQVTHNDIGDFYYTGISGGWVWGYTPSPSKRNRLDYNHIHHLGFGVLSDMGAVYLLGRAEGTTVNHNYIHHVASYRYGGWGLYTDEGSTGVVMDSNLVHDTTNAGFHQHYGKWNRISNNILAFGRQAQIQRSRPEKHASFCFENNIVLCDSPRLLDGSWYNWEPGTLEMRHNLYWRTDGQPPQFIDTDLSGWQKRTGRDEGSAVADPLFVNAAKRDFRLKPESPAFKLGFTAFDSTLAGVRGTGDWRRQAMELNSAFSNWDRETQPWPMPTFALDENFEHMGLSFPTLPRQEIHWQNKGDRLVVCDEQAASGRRSVKFLDAPGLERVWYPHLVLKPKCDSGRVTSSFAMLFEKGALMDYEWRDDDKPYKVGPSFSVRGGKLQIRNGPNMEIPAGVWVGLLVSSGCGPQSDGKWRLEVSLPGQPVRKFESLPCQEGWTKLDWIGWTSAADEQTVFYLDDLKFQQEDSKGL
jgi:hypothetical protein